MLLKSILKKCPVTHTQGWIQLLKEVNEQNVSLVMCQRRFGSIFQCPVAIFFAPS